MGSTMALKRTNAEHNGISVNLFFIIHACIHAKKHCKIILGIQLGDMVY